MSKSRFDTYLDNLTWLVAGTLFLFMLGFFFVPNAVDQYKFFGFAVFLPALPLLPLLVKTSTHDRLLLLVVAYLLWMLLSSLWSVSFSTEEFLKTLRLVAYITVFILLVTYLEIRKPAESKFFVGLLASAATLAALVSIPLWYSSHPFPESRIVGIGTLNNPNPSAFVYGFFALVSCRLVLGHNRTWLKLMFALCALLLTVFVFLTQSNTGILATTSSIALFLLLRHGGRLLHLSIGVLVGLGTLLFLLYSLGILEKPMDSGLTARIQIWEKVIGQIEDAPLIGHGQQKQLLIDEHGKPDTANYAHNAFLASFRDGGFVAATLYLLILATALVTAANIYKRNKEPAYMAYLLFGFTCMLTDTDQLITRPRELWIIFWWPLAMIIAGRIVQRTTENGSGNKSAE